MCLRKGEVCGACHPLVVLLSTWEAQSGHSTVWEISKSHVRARRCLSFGEADIGIISTRSLVRVLSGRTSPLAPPMGFLLLLSLLLLLLVLRKEQHSLRAGMGIHLSFFFFFLQRGSWSPFDTDFGLFVERMSKWVSEWISIKCIAQSRCPINYFNEISN